MKVYKDVIDKGVIIIMVFYSSWNGVKMYVNYFLLIKVLKEQLGFKGFIILDYMGIDQIIDLLGVNYMYFVYVGI